MNSMTGLNNLPRKKVKKSDLIKIHLLFWFLIIACLTLFVDESLLDMIYQSKALSTFISTEAIVIDKIVCGEKRSFFEIKYRYSINSQAYENNELYPLSASKGLFGSSYHGDSIRRHKRYYDKYRNNQKINIYFNPCQPAESFIVPEVSDRPYVAAVAYIGGLCLFIASYFEMLFHYRYIRESYDDEFHPEISIPKGTFKKYLHLSIFWHVYGIYIILQYLIELKIAHNNYPDIRPLDGHDFFGFAWFIAYEIIGILWLMLVFKIRRNAVVGK